ncbi:MAG TPA: Wzz/FepE/Etk N-terminal domain-containing protein, partial [Gemmatimonadales bacterium]|nr:Wzz/FepE/Etk N-terminal domain-containing protein [Gemmatimonadales bacterium]
MANPVGPEQPMHMEVTAAPTPVGVEPYSSPAPPSVATLTRVVSSLRRFRWVITGLTLLGLGAGIAATRIIKPDYAVQATIWIETPSQGRAGTPIQGEELLASKAWLELLTTFKVLDPVVQSRRLFLTIGDEADRPLFTEFDLSGRFLPGQFELTIEKDGRGYQLKQRNGIYAEAGNLADSVG